jgi:hypothetical protein
MVQRRRPSLQGLQVMPRIEHLLVLAVTARMRRDHLTALHDLDLLDIGFDRDHLEGGAARHAIPVGIVAHHLVLVRLGRLQHAGIEDVCRQGQGLLTLARKALADGLGPFGLDAVAVTHTAGAQVGIQGGQVADLGHRRGPVTLQMAHPALDVSLLLRPAHQTEQRREGIVADQRLIALMELARAAREQVGRHRLGIVPPQLVRHAAEEAEGLDQALQDGLGTFARQRQREGAVGVGPGGHQHRNELPALGEINVDVAKVTFQPLTGIMVQGDKGLAAPSAREQVLPDPFVGAGKAVLVAKTAKDFCRGVTLLARRLFIVLDDGVDERLEGIKD